MVTMRIKNSSGAQSRMAGSTWSDLSGAARTYLEGFANPESFIRELLEKAGIEIGGDASRRSGEQAAANAAGTDRGDASARPSEDGDGQENQA